MSKQAMETDWIDRVVQDVAELSDRNSPEDWPEAMLVTGEELRQIIEHRTKEAIKQHDAEPVAKEQIIERITGAIHRHMSTPVYPREVAEAARYIVDNYTSAPSIPEGWQQNVKVSKVIDSDWPDAHQVRLKVGVQSFDIGLHHETKEEAFWYADMFIKAITSMLSASPQSAKGEQ